MSYSDQFFSALNISKDNKTTVREFSRKTGIPIDRLYYYNENNIVPSGDDLEMILDVGKLTNLELCLKMGRLSKDILDAISENCTQVSEAIAKHIRKKEEVVESLKPEFSTNLGKMYRNDCVSVLSTIDNDTVDLIFADPPFNLDKIYPSEMDDNIKTEKYIHWCQEWLMECIRVLKPGGSIFLWNLPKWNASLTEFLNGYLTFRNWIGVDIKYSLPIKGRLYPSHYSLLYYVKGDRPNTFNPDRLQMQTCGKCYSEIKDYGGYKNKMNPLGINLTDIWTDISPVRHAKYKRRQGSNELSLKLLDRIIEMSSSEGDLVFDPFGGAGTTYMAAELKNRRWIGSEIGPLDIIKERFDLIDLEREILSEFRKDLNILFPEKVEKQRLKNGLWTPKDFE
jgi:site-specific DNA-methyltransferase (adenine-specific)